MHLARITELSNRYYGGQQQLKEGMPRLSVFSRNAPSQ
jgi:hypothetical protein